MYILFQIIPKDITFVILDSLLLCEIYILSRLSKAWQNYIKSLEDSYIKSRHPRWEDYCMIKEIVPRNLCEEDILSSYVNFLNATGRDPYVRIYAYFHPKNKMSRPQSKWNIVSANLKSVHMTTFSLRTTAFERYKPSEQRQYLTTDSSEHTSFSTREYLEDYWIGNFLHKLIKKFGLVECMKRFPLSKIYCLFSYHARRYDDVLTTFRLPINEMMNEPDKFTGMSYNQIKRLIECRRLEMQVPQLKPQENLVTTDDLETLDYMKRKEERRKRRDAARKREKEEHEQSLKRRKIENQRNGAIIKEIIIK